MTTSLNAHDVTLPGTMFERVITYLRRYPSRVMTSDKVPPAWPQQRVAGGLIARGCNGSTDHGEEMSCWAFYPDPERIH